MGTRNRDSKLTEKRRKVKSRLFEDSDIELLQKKFDLSDETVHAATLILRFFTGLGKGLTPSQKKSYSAASVWYATKLVEERTLSKEDLAEKIDISPRTLARRFQELEEDKDSKIVLDYVKKRIKSWSKKRERKLRDLL